MFSKLPLYTTNKEIQGKCTTGTFVLYSILLLENFKYDFHSNPAPLYDHNIL